MTNKEQFTNDILYSNKSIIADDRMYKAVARFIEDQDEEYWDETDIDEIHLHFDYFLAIEKYSDETM